MGFDDGDLGRSIRLAEINRETYNLYDTVGLGEHHGIFDRMGAAKNHYRLMTDLSNSGGVIKCDRLT